MASDLGDAFQNAHGFSDHFRADAITR